MNDKRATIEIIAPTIEEAIGEGLEKFGLPEDAVDVEVLDEGSKGLFGLGSRQARVRLTIKTVGENLETPDAVQEETTTATETTEPASSEELDEDEDIITLTQETISDLLERMKIQAEVTVRFGEPDDDQRWRPILADIHGKDLSILIGKKAETLNALQYITRLILGKELERSVPLSVDVEGYRKRRERQIRRLAKRVAEQVRETGRSQALEPMPPNERRLVHIELRQDRSVFTESTGEGSRRKVVIYPKQ
jgi:spoIIIJ-associated protein